MRIEPHYFRDVPEQKFLLSVKVNRDACGPPPIEIANRLDSLEKVGITLTLLQIVQAAAMLYGTPSGAPEHDIHHAWHTLEEWNFHATSDHFIAEPPKNDLLQTEGTQALGMAVGVLVAEQIYALPLQFWQRTNNNATFDFQGVQPYNGKTLGLRAIGLEARARLDRNHWAEAVDQAAKS